MQRLHLGLGNRAGGKKCSVHYERFVCWFKALFLQYVPRGRGLDYEFRESAFYRYVVLRLRDPVTGFTHIIAVKVSERYAVPPWLFNQFVDRFWRQLQRLYSSLELSRADLSIFIVGNMTRGVFAEGYKARRLSGKTVLVYPVQARHRTLKSVIARILQVIARYYGARVTAIREKIRRLREQGRDWYEIDRLEIRHLHDFLTLLLRKLEGITAVLQGTGPPPWARYEVM